MTTKQKKVYKESANPDKPNIELRLSYFNEDETFEILIHYLFDLVPIKRYNRTGIIYKPGFYMEHFKPDLELELIKETDKMYLVISGADGNRHILMNPKYVKRINNPELSNNHFGKAVLKRIVVESCMNKLKEEYRAILYYFLDPNSTLESKNIKNSIALKIYANAQSTRVKKMKNSINMLVNQIVILQEGLL